MHARDPATPQNTVYLRDYSAYRKFGILLGVRFPPFAVEDLSARITETTLGKAVGGAMRQGPEIRRLK